MSTPNQLHLRLSSQLYSTSELSAYYTSLQGVYNWNVLSVPLGSMAVADPSAVEKVLAKVRQVTANKSKIVVSLEKTTDSVNGRLVAKVANWDAVSAAITSIRQELATATGIKEISQDGVTIVDNQPTALKAQKSWAHVVPSTIELDSVEVVLQYHEDDRVILGRSLFSKNWFFTSALFVNGRWIEPINGKTLPVTDPSLNMHTHWIYVADAADVPAAVEAAKTAFGEWSVTPATYRSQFLEAIAAEIACRKEDLATMESLDNGKPLKEAFSDIDDVVGCFQYYAKEIIEFEKKNGQNVDVGNPSFSAVVKYEPVGVAGLIIPWNYPLLMAAWKVAPCIASGSTCVLKPSELTPLTALELGFIANKVGLPKGVLNILNGDGPTLGNPLTQHPDIHKVAFTGSVVTGSRVMENASKAIKTVTLELGGKSPIIVFDDADLEQAVDWVMTGIFFNCGQVCSATSRLIVHADIQDKLLARLAEETNKLVIGNGLQQNVDIGPIISESQWKKVLNYIRIGKEEGATVLCGGVVPEHESLKKGYFVKPTIFYNVKPEMTIWKEEIFGPVLSTVTFTTESEALHLANNTPYGLAGAVISSDKEKAMRVAQRLRCGIVWINCSQPTFCQLPWGGMKQSGIGRELGRWGLMNYLETKQITSWVDTEATGWGWFKKSNM